MLARYLDAINCAIILTLWSAFISVRWGIPFGQLKKHLNNFASQLKLPGRDVRINFTYICRQLSDVFLPRLLKQQKK